MLGWPSRGSRQFRVAARAGTVAVGGTDRIERERLTVDALDDDLVRFPPICTVGSSRPDSCGRIRDRLAPTQVASCVLTFCPAGRSTPACSGQKVAAQSFATVAQSSACRWSVLPHRRSGHTGAAAGRRGRRRDPCRSECAAWWRWDRSHRRPVSGGERQRLVQGR